MAGDRFFLKFPDPEDEGLRIIGRYRDHRWEEEKPPPGHLLVDDIIYPVRYHAPADQCEAVEWDVVEQLRDAFCAEAVGKSREATEGIGERDVVVDQLFKVAIAGVPGAEAYYVVTDVSATRCEVEWRWFTFDSWVDPYLEWGGEFSLRQIRRYTRHDREAVA